MSDNRKRNVKMKPEGNIENDTINDEGMRNVEDGQERNDNEEMMRSSDMSPFNEEEVLPFSGQQDESNTCENISLKSAPPISVASSLFVNYKMMLLTIPERLLSSDVTAMKEWARRQFSIEHAQDATEILHQLDRRLIISASNLSVLHSFFESIIRFDLIHIIDGYLAGDYSVFEKRSANEKPRRENHGTRSSYKSLLMSTNDRLSLQYSSTASKPIPKRNNDVSSHRSIQRPSNPFLPVNINVSNPVAKHPHENQSEDSLTQKPKSSIATNTIVREVHVMNTSFNNASNPLRSSGLPKGIQFPGSNGRKHSKFNNNSQNSEVVLTSREGNWLCSHYKRHCFVKFDCCEQFYPCHRCHNNQSACGNKKLKSRDVKKVKCAYCSNVQEFDEKCTNCGVKFAEYFCALCKHLTGKDDQPYHCKKCGICRVHGDRSFHCDVCGVCLDVQLRGNHKCRENSAHDECCICLEDIFSGCQILPCSHKVHKECAVQMIRSGKTRCPICRESFAHKLEKKSTKKQQRKLRMTLQEGQERNLCSRLESVCGKNRQNSDSLPEICFRFTRNGNPLQQEQGFQQETQPSNDRHLPQAERQGENNEQSRHHDQNKCKKAVYRNYVHLEEDHSREPVIGQLVEPISSPRLECTTCGRNLEIETSDSSQRNNLKNVLLQIMQNLDERQRTSLLHEICSCTEIENPRRSMQGREVMEFLMGQLHHLRRQGKCIICVLKYALQRIGCSNLVTITRLMG
ncbi:uncharacterized protein LOC124445039 isoform X2 [Xenia sp. Carnegie-2017]|uniref:uncharacterized protein LOC124445039 isoform X2 n=1 Tax=Xenia sp. Carnegie-2017 TaxID=2897299 RepID=UPI001F04AD24|nr:uncharacterized protein LOC124445039 isoform X2 [Xenia sp. Carnegie-2017]